MEEQLVTLEVAKLLRKKGFNEPCLYYYGINNRGKQQAQCIAGIEDPYCRTIKDFNICNKEDLFGNEYTQPTQSLAQKWLRETRGIIIIVDYNMTYPRKWNYEYWKDNLWEYSDEYYETYEEALEEGLKYCLESI